MEEPIIPFFGLDDVLPDLRRALEGNPTPIPETPPDNVERVLKGVVDGLVNGIDKFEKTGEYRWRDGGAICKDMIDKMEYEGMRNSIDGYTKEDFFPKFEYEKTLGDAII